MFQGALERLSPLRGQDTPCIVTVTYGNRDFDDALLELTRFCQERGFLPFAGAALVGEHTYGSIALGRPDAEDLLQDRAFALEAWEDFQAGVGELLAPGELPLQRGWQGRQLYPLHHPGLHPLRAVRPAVSHAGHWGGLRRHRWGEVYRLLPVREKLPCPGEGRVHPRVPELCRGFLRKAERA